MALSDASQLTQWHWASAWTPVAQVYLATRGACLLAQLVQVPLHSWPQGWQRHSEALSRALHRQECLCALAPLLLWPDQDLVLCVPESLLWSI